LPKSFLFPSYDICSIFVVDGITNHDFVKTMKMKWKIQKQFKQKKKKENFLSAIRIVSKIDCWNFDFFAFLLGFAAKVFQIIWFNGYKFAIVLYCFNWVNDGFIFEGFGFGFGFGGWQIANCWFLSRHWVVKFWVDFLIVDKTAREIFFSENLFIGAFS
jgi:hypothetical protein